MSCPNLRAPSGTVKPIPYAALPHELRRDRRLNARAVVTAAALLEYARDKATCWPSVGRLADDMGVKPRTVQFALKSLRGAGWIAVRPTADNPTRRVIALAWRGAGDCAPPAQKNDAGGVQPIAPELKKGEGEKERPESAADPSSPPPPAGEEGEEVPLETLLAWAGGTNATLARIGCAALAEKGYPLSADPIAPPSAAGHATTSVPEPSPIPEPPGRSTDAAIAPQAAVAPGGAAPVPPPVARTPRAVGFDLDRGESQGSPRLVPFIRDERGAEARRGRGRGGGAGAGPPVRPGPGGLNPGESYHGPPGA